MLLHGNIPPAAGVHGGRPVANAATGARGRGSQIETTIIWYLIIGALLVLMGLSGSVLERLPLSPAMLYLVIGFILGPSAANLVRIDPLEHAGLLTSMTEVALLISLFAVGLRLRVEPLDRIWHLPWRLGMAGMLVTAGLIAAVGVRLLDLPLGAAVLLGAVLSPTDPVLASDVQIKDVGDRDKTRFSLSGEGGLNDGTAYPLAMLGLALLGVQQAQHFRAPAALLTAAWGIAAGIGSGWLLGRAIVHLALYVRKRFREALGMEEFFALGLVALSYGVAHVIHGIGFLAVFAAGVAMRRVEQESSGQADPAEIIGAIPAGAAPSIATDPGTAPAYMAETILGFNEQLEHIAEFIMVLLLGIILSGSGLSLQGFLLGAALLLAIRPVAVGVSLAGADVKPLQRWLMGWFGIRGIGSLYYLVFALQYSWDRALMERFVPLVLTAVAVSVVAHGVSATPLMALYRRKRPADG